MTSQHKVILLRGFWLFCWMHLFILKLNYYVIILYLEQIKCKESLEVTNATLQHYSFCIVWPAT